MPLQLAVTDANGRYSFPELPGSDYIITFKKPGYYATANGALAFGQQKSLDIQLAPVPIPSITITSPLNGAVYSSPRQITVVGTVSSNATVTVNGIPAYINNVTFSATISIADGANTITAVAKNQYEETASTTVTVTVPTAPKITGITAASATVDSAVVQWVTDSTASSRVQYGETTGYVGLVDNAALTTVHSVALSGLKPSTTYHYRVSSTNSYGLSTTSADFTFTTPQFTAKMVGDIGNVAVMEVTGDYNADMADCLVYTPPRQEIAKEFIRTHGDNFDFLVYLSNFDYAMREPKVKGFYIEARNDTVGTGNVLIDRSADFGSLGKLQGTIDLGNVLPLAANPYGSKLDETITILNHELMHRWGAHAIFKNPDGTFNTSLLGEDNAHWSYLLDTKASLMYGNAWKDNGNGTFTSTAGMSGYSPLDLYLMGMIPKEQVPPMLLIDNPAIDKTKLPEPGTTITGTARAVTIEEIVAALGERVPNAAVSPKSFKVGFVLLTMPGTAAGSTPEAIETLRSAWAGRFAELTQRKGGIANVPASLNVTIDSPADGSTVVGPDVTVTGTVINSTGAETGVVVNGVLATVFGSRFVANHVPLQEGANTVTVAAVDVNRLAATATRNFTAVAGHYIRITANIESGIAPLNTLLSLNGSFSITNPTMTLSGPVPIIVTPGASPMEYTAQFTLEGTYTITASAVGPDGQIYSDTMTIPVLSKAQLDNLLEAKWSAMRGALAKGDVAGATAYFSDLTKDSYQEQFTEIAAFLPQIASTITNITIVKVQDNFAEYDLRDIIDGVTYSYYLSFIKERDGLWKIKNF